MSTRKTAKYYREELMKNHNLTTLTTLIKEVVAKYGKDKQIRLKNDEFNWNHQVTGFSVSTKGIVYVDVYWQGDSTDGDTCVSLTDVYNRGKVTIKAEHFFDGYRTRCKHSDINVEKYEVVKLISLLAEYLSPSAIKERKLKAEIAQMERVISDKMGNEYFSKYARKFGDNEEYYNGRRAVNKLVEQEKNNFVKMDINKVLEIVDVVFKKNYKNNRYFGGSLYQSNTKSYDLTY
jgi:hypothetical protein